MVISVALHNELMILFYELSMKHPDNLYCPRTKERMIEDSHATPPMKRPTILKQSDYKGRGTLVELPDHNGKTFTVLIPYNLSNSSGK